MCEYEKMTNEIMPEFQSCYLFSRKNIIEELLNGKAITYYLYLSRSI